MKMLMKPMTLLRRLENKVISVRELSRYLGTKSLDDLLLTLRRLAHEDYCGYDVTLCAEYFEWQRAHRDVIFENDILYPFDYTYKAMRERDTYGLSVKANKPLAEKEVAEIIQKLPPDLAEKHLRFKLTNIDQEKLYEFVMTQQKTSSTNKDEYYDRIKHNGLVVDGVEVTYNDEPVATSFQHRQTLRLLMKKKESCATKMNLKMRKQVFLASRPKIMH